MARGAIKAVQSAGHVVAVHKKYTVQSTGIWERIRTLLAVAPERSNGVPLNAQFRLPAPGSNPPLDYDDPVTLPASDLADNPYWKRDVRRNYPRLSTFTQADSVSLLTVGSQAAPRDDVLKLGEAGTQQLIEVKAQAEERGLAALFEQDKTSIQGVLGANGLPPLPGHMNNSKESHSKYHLAEEQSYPEKYPCRTFA